MQQNGISQEMFDAGSWLMHLLSVGGSLLRVISQFNLSKCQDY